MYSPLVVQGQSSVVIAGIVRIGVRSWGRAGDELLIELTREAPNVIGLAVQLEDGARRLAAVVKDERVQDGRSVLVCNLAEDDANGAQGVGA
jgi:hypothetical protein